MSRKLIDIRHPNYADDSQDWIKWRLAYQGGRKFIDRYIKKLSIRESDSDFSDRKEMAYCAAFASAAINKIKDAIYQRMSDVQRVGGPQSYTDACGGLLGGVDLTMTTMNTFIGTKVLPELLTMKRVGVLTDNAAQLGVTLADKGNKHPYLGLYCAESIFSWSYSFENNIRKLKAVLLKDDVESIDEETSLPCGMTDRYRLMQVTEDGVKVTFYDGESTPYQTVILETFDIPFTIFEVNESLMMNVADYQIALTNLESSDISFLRKSNYPFYFEFYDPKSEQVYGKPVAAPGEEGTRAEQRKSKAPEIAVGSTQGRRFASGLEKPGFIAPDADSIRVSMEKEQQIKEDIERLVNLNLTQIGTERRSAESKEMDRSSLDSSLGYIGLILAKGESEIAKHWSFFEGVKNVAKITYPDDYSLKSDVERRAEAQELQVNVNSVPSDTYKRITVKRIAHLTVARYATDDDMKKIYKEIEQADTLTSDPDQIIADLEAGLVGNETASLARGYKQGEVEKAKKDKAENIRMVLEAQGGPDNASAARGAADFGGTSGASEKVNKQKRGDGKKINKETQQK